MRLKNLFAVSLILFFAINSFAQIEKPRPNELRLTYGTMSIEQISLMMTTALLGGTFGGIFGGNVKDIDGDFIGPVSLQYHRMLDKSNFSVGGVIGYSNSKATVTYEKYPNTPFEVKLKYLIIMGEADFHYINGKSFQLYSGLGFGAGVILPDDPSGVTSDNEIKPAFQFTAAGFKFGSGSFGGSVDIGFGSKGIFAGGLYARF